MVDVVCASVGTLALSPFLPLVALAIRIDSRGPVFYRQVRVGAGGEPFELLKLRTMVDDADRRGGPISTDRDERITRTGRLIRPIRLDEAPQLWNVLRGDMTLIGPRPEVLSLVALYTESERAVLDVRPGLAGAGQLFFQIHRARALEEVDDPLAYHIDHQLHEKLAVDLEYLARRSWLTDLGLVGRTVLFAFGCRRPWLAPLPPHAATPGDGLLPPLGGDDEHAAATSVTEVIDLRDDIPRIELGDVRPVDAVAHGQFDGRRVRPRRHRA
jgi:lipopolysaccharide/colanic/teichoic acid biosynthesis glycosyltransferase